jgi:type IV secretory pathway VirD2 relaxase
VISRDYIAGGLRARAGDLVTRELGLRSEREVRRGFEAEVSAERRTLVRKMARHSYLSLTRQDRKEELTGFTAVVFESAIFEPGKQIEW